MPNPGRPKVFDETKRREYLALITVGCSRPTACEYCGINSTTVRNTARRDPEFRRQLVRAEIVREFRALRNIGHAGTKNWRASAWLLERTVPSRYAPRTSDLMTREEWNNQLRGLGAAVYQLLPDDAARRAFAQRVNQFIGDEDAEDGKDCQHLDDPPLPRTVEEWRDEYLAHLPLDVNIDETSLDDPQEDQPDAPEDPCGDPIAESPSGDSAGEGDPTPADPPSDSPSDQPPCDDSQNNDLEVAPDAPNCADLCANSGHETAGRSVLNQSETST